MIKDPSVTPFGYTVFCDDIRQEIAGKLTLVGSYGHHMVLHQNLPVTLPRLALWVNYFERPGESDEPVELFVYMPGEKEPSVREPLDLGSLRAGEGERPVIAQRLRGPDPWDPLMPARGVLIFSPVVITEEGQIRVRAKRGKDFYRLGSLLVTVADKPEFEQEASSAA